MPLKVSLPPIKGPSFRDWGLKRAIIIGVSTSVISLILVAVSFLQQFLVPSVVSNSFYPFHFGILLLALTLFALWMLLVFRHGFQPALHVTEMRPLLPEVQPLLLAAPRPTNKQKPDEGKKEQTKRGEVFAKQSGNVFCFSLAKEYDIEDEDNEDSFDWDNTRRRYAVADGVSTSFIPAPWAKIVAEAFVRYPKDFHDGEQFEEQAFRLWLAQCSQDWRNWMYGSWLPKNSVQREREGRPPRNWTTQINQNGAQTTLIGCSLSPVNNHMLQCRVLAVGDAQFFHFRRTPRGRWALVYSFPYTDPRQFGRRTAVLATRQDLWEIACKEKAFTTRQVDRGDLLVLTSDALGEWILEYKDREEEILTQLLTLRDAEKLKSLILTERQHERMKNDDVTMMIIPVG